MTIAKTIALRPHHLLCLLTYVGKGYSPAFVAGYDRIVARLSAGEEIEIISGPDDICAPIACDLTEHCHGTSVISRDARAAQDVAQLLGTEITPGARLTLTPEITAALRAAFATGEIRSACPGCEWEALCTEVAKDGFPGGRFRP
ncbi:DUF1284 domain-containing protein [Celeribacter sp. PS-C1]|uniref:DUF1284 domain-containing protein n=1 Tax=Celeribacter sp. PS-C1 TaxID=2820813 RepID=UPI001CA4AEFE|nr:DUF1284 domain-containing protein [Celeribacter sp. PS-C1]MBW6417740.1 DUF1284 domain-containing protein [Celeribacter sp. PS-C1]